MGYHSDRRLATSLAVLLLGPLSILAARIADCSGETEQERLLLVEGWHSRKTWSSYPSHRIRWAAGLRWRLAMWCIRSDGCACPGKTKWWYYRYVGQEEHPFTFTENEWSLSIGCVGAEKPVGLTLSHIEAREGIEKVPSDALPKVTTACVDDAGVQTGALHLHPKLRTVLCDPEITQEAFACVCRNQPYLVGLDLSYCERL